MFKLHEGKMTEFWIVPGKLPQMLGVVGGESDTESIGGGADSGPGPNSSPVDGEEDEYDYLNGQDSPFYQPPSNDGPRAGGDY